MTCGGPEHEHMAGDPVNIGRCRFCRQEIEWGKTVKGITSLFDPDTKRNHWITCPNQKAARADYPHEGRPE